MPVILSLKRNVGIGESEVEAHPQLHTKFQPSGLRHTRLYLKTKKQINRASMSIYNR